MYSGMTGDPSSSTGGNELPTEPVQMWLVERTFSDDEQNIVILRYATTDGRFVHRKERALPSFERDGLEPHVAVRVAPNDVRTVDDPDRRDWFRTEATRMAQTYQPDDTI